jgi:FAD/FMN-containing dehydrogenase
VPPALPDKLRSIVGASHVLTGVDCSPYAVEGRAPEAVVFPGTKEEIAAVLLAAGEAGLPVTPWGAGTKMAIGSPPHRIGLVLGLKRLDRILEHEPGDLTVTVEAGLPFGPCRGQLGKRGSGVPRRGRVGGPPWAACSPATPRAPASTSTAPRAAW